MNSICDLLHIKYPILQGAMAWISTHSLAAAVSEAGGLGIIAAGNAPADWVRNEIRALRAATDKPFGVNVMLLSPFADEVAKVIEEEKVPVVTTGAGNAGKYIEAWKKNGTKVIPLVPSVALAKRMQRSGVDAVIAEGCESGGHIGEITTMALVPQIVDAVDLPVIGAGGIADGRGFASAMMLGAEGVQIGTRFLVAKECTVHEAYKARVLKAGDIEAVVTGRNTGHPVRSLRNQLTREFDKLERSGATLEELEALGVGRLRQAAVDGDVMNGSVLCGQIAGLVKKEQTAKEIIEDLIRELEDVINAREEKIRREILELSK